MQLQAFYLIECIFQGELSFRVTHSVIATPKGISFVFSVLLGLQVSIQDHPSLNIICPADLLNGFNSLKRRGTGLPIAGLCGVGV